MNITRSPNMASSYNSSRYNPLTNLSVGCNSLKTFQTPNMALGQNVIRTNLSSLHNPLRFAQILCVTVGYSQKKKDSVQAVFIQRYTNYPDYIGLAQRLPNSIGSVQRLPDDIGLVQPLGSIPCRFNSLRHASLTHALNDVSTAAVLICSNRASSKRICFIVLPERSNAFFSFFSCIGNYHDYNEYAYGNYHSDITQWLLTKKTTPRSAVNTNEAFNHNVMESYDMAMYKSTQTHPKFKWRFFSCQQSRYFTVEARSEQEARSMLPDAPCLFSARIRQGVSHA